MGQKFSNNCIGDVNDICEPKKIVVQSNSNNSMRRNSSQNSLNTQLLYNSYPLSRKPSFVRFVETTNKELRNCYHCQKFDNILVQYNQCIECGNFHCGFHRSVYHESHKYYECN